MSVTAHLTEMFLVKYEMPRLNFRWLIVGCYFPDGFGMSKVLQVTTGSSIFHRDALFGWTHSFPVCGVFALAIGARFGRLAGWSFATAAWLHTIMDLGDPLGVKLFYPFLDRKFSLGLWPWTDTDLLLDTLTYYTAPWSLGTELLFLAAALWVCFKVAGNPIRATKALWRRDGWSDRPARSPEAAPTAVAAPVELPATR